MISDKYILSYFIIIIIRTIIEWLNRKLAFYQLKEKITLPMIKEMFITYIDDVVKII